MQAFRNLYCLQKTANIPWFNATLGLRAMASIPQLSPKESKIKTVTLIPGDGIGPECCDAVTGIFAAAKVPIQWERFDNLSENPEQIQEVFTSISRNKYALKGPLYTSNIEGPASRNVQIRKTLDLFANIVPIKSVPGVTTRHGGEVDLVVIRENTEGEYSGLELEVAPGVVQSIKVITEQASLRIAEFAFKYATLNNRKKVTAVHKANIQKLSDGEFIACCKKVSKDYPDIEYEEMIVDNCSMQLAMRPSQFDVMVTPNLYGTIVANIAAGLIGGPGLLPGANIGSRGQAIFESGARHVALDIVGENKANPVGTLLASCMMLRHMQLHEHADRIERGIQFVLAKKVFTPDLGGAATTKEFTQRLINFILTDD